MTLKLNFYFTLLSLLMRPLASDLFAQHRDWKILRQEGTNFYAIQDSFEHQNAALLQAFRNTPSAVADTTGRFTEIIQYYRWARRVQPRVAESQGDLSAMTSGSLRALNPVNAALQVRIGEAWHSLNPSNPTASANHGRINQVRIHPTNPNILFACAPTGGLWKSINNGDSWFPIAENLTFVGCSDVAFLPSDPNTMYLATGDGDGTESYSTGVYKSTDGGNTWLPTGLVFTTAIGQQQTLSRILVSPNGTILVAGSGGMRRSTDGGATWTFVSGLKTHDIAFQPNNPNVVYAAQLRSTYLGGNLSFSRSQDGGATWITIANGLPGGNTVRTVIGVTPADANYVYLLAATADNYGFRGIFRSTDAGLTFTNVLPLVSNNNVLGWSATGNDVGGQGWFDLAIAVSPTNRDEFFTGGINIWKTTNGGQSFTIASHWRGENGLPTVHSGIHSLAFHGTTLWGSSDGGVFNSTNQGTTWTHKNNQLNIAQIHAFGQSVNNRSLLVSGHENNGSHLRTAPNQSVQVTQGDGMQCFIDRTNDNNIFTSNYEGHLYRSTNGGNSFAELSRLPDSNQVTAFLQDPVSPNTLYAGGKRVYKSTDFGNTWATIINWSEDWTIPVAAISVARTNNQILFAIKDQYWVPTYRPELYKSSDGGVSWGSEGFSFRIPTPAALLGVHVDVNNENRIYVGVASYTGHSVYFSDNGGQNWQNISAGLPQVPANCFVTTIGSTNGEVFVGTDLGVYRKTNLMAQWEPFNNQLPRVSVTDLQIYAPDGLLRAATYGRGLWEIALPSLNLPPTVQLTAPTQGQRFQVPTTIQLTATASDADGRVARVEFYRDTILLNVDSVAPYAYTWTNVPINPHRIIAKAMDSLGAVATSSADIIVTGANDAQIVSILAPTTLITTPTFTPMIRLKNAGSQVLTHANLHVQLNQQAIQTMAWTGTLAAQAEMIVNLPNISGYGNGMNRFQVYVSSPNNGADEQSNNDTLRQIFDYQQVIECADNFEPNNTDSTAAPIPSDVTVRSKITGWSDNDYFRFQTTGARTAFKVVLKELPFDCDLEVFQYNYTTRQAHFIGRSELANNNIESLVFNNVIDTGTYIVRVYPYRFNETLTQCYALQVQTFEPIYYDLALLAIESPQNVIYNNAFTPIARFKNNSSTPLTTFKLRYQLDSGTVHTYQVVLPNALVPNDSVTLTFPSLVQNGYTGGFHQFKLFTELPNGFPDRNRHNDTLTTAFQYKIRPVVALTTPADGQQILATSTIRFAATATAGNGATITKVEFYKDSILMGTSYSAPYTFNWLNVPVGIYRLSAKAYDSNQLTATSAIRTVSVIGMNDAGGFKFANEADFLADSIVTPIAQIHNYAAMPLTSVTFHYQFDNQPVTTQTLTGLSVPYNTEYSLVLPTVRYGRGAHQFKVWTTLPNGLMDDFAQNDTFRFAFELNFDNLAPCSARFEPNDEITEAKRIPTDAWVGASSVFGSEGFVDYFVFKTTAQKPNFTIILRGVNDPATRSISINRWSPNQSALVNVIYADYEGLRSADSVQYYEGLDTGTYYLRLSFRAPQMNCYSIMIRTLERNDLGIDTVFYPNGVVGLDGTAFFEPIVRVRNQGNTTIYPVMIQNPIIRTMIDGVSNSWGSLQLSHPMLPNDTISVRIESSSPTAGVNHVFKAYTTLFGDRNRSNDTATSPFQLVTSLWMRWMSPQNNQFFPPHSTIPLSAQTYNVARVEYWNGTTFLGFNSVAPYKFNWVNAPIGTHQLYAKAIDNRGQVTTTSPITIHVGATPDAGVVTLTNHYQFAIGDSVEPTFRIRNYSTQPLTRLTVHYRFDDGAVQTQTNQRLNVAFGETALFSFPMIRYNYGRHRVTVWTTLPNGSADQNPLNDTLRYDFNSYDMSVCSDLNEPNSFAQPTPMPLNTKIRGRVGFWDNEDVFIFRTTQAQPFFTILLDETAERHEFELYKWDSSDSSNTLLLPWMSATSFFYARNPDSCTYILSVRSFANSNQCYALQIATQAAPQFDIGVDSILTPNGSLTTLVGGAVRIKNYGSETIQHFQLRAYSDSRLIFNQMIYPPNSLGPYQSMIQELWVSFDTSAGTHRFTACTHAPNGGQDRQPMNDTLRSWYFSGTPPTVQLTSPTNGQSFSYTTPVNLAATATASTGIAQVEFYAGATLIGIDSTAPYTFLWNAPVGTHQLTAKASESSGRFAISTAATITITNSLPTVTLTSPINGQRFNTGSSILLAATAADADGPIVKVEFFKNGTLLGTSNRAPYTFVWTNVANGNYALTAKAFDNVGGITTTSATNIVVATNVPPTVTLTTPTEGQIFNFWSDVVLSATAADADGSISKVEFYRGNFLLGTSLSAPYRYTWVRAANGTFAFSAKAYDNDGNVTTSNVINATILPNQQPTVQLTQPTRQEVITVANASATAQIAIAATANDADGSIAYVSFYQNGNWLGTDSVAPYTQIWANVPVGAYPLTATATDRQFGFTTSTVVPISVAVPSIAWVTPANRQLVLADSNVWLEARPIDSTLQVVKMVFYSNNVLLGTDSVAPYRHDWRNVPAGTHRLKVQMYDLFGWIAVDSSRIIESVIRLDANLQGVNRPTGLVTVDTSLFQVAFRNNGYDTLVTLRFNYRLNQDTNRLHIWRGSLVNQDSTIAHLPPLHIPAEGTQTLMIWSSLPNHAQDKNLRNDTLIYHFVYNRCGDNYEPNDSMNTAVRIEPNKPYYAVIARPTDMDYYRFSTSNAQPKVRITAQHPNLDAELQLFRVETNGNWTALAAANRRGVGRELLIWNSSVQGGHYGLLVKGFNNRFDADSCYHLLVETADTLMTRSEEMETSGFDFKLAPNPATDLVRIWCRSATENTDYQIVVTDMLGRTVFNQRFETLPKPLFMETANWAKGMYFVTVRHQGQMKTEKLSIE